MLEGYGLAMGKDWRSSPKMGIWTIKIRRLILSTVSRTYQEARLLCIFNEISVWCIFDSFNMKAMFPRMVLWSNGIVFRERNISKCEILRSVSKISWCHFSSLLGFTLEPIPAWDMTNNRDRGPPGIMRITLLHIALVWDQTESMWERNHLRRG